MEQFKHLLAMSRLGGEIKKGSKTLPIKLTRKKIAENKGQREKSLGGDQREGREQVKGEKARRKGG